MFPSRYCLMPNQNASAMLAYMEKNMGAIWVPNNTDIDRPCFLASSTAAVCFPVSVFWAPSEQTARIDPKISPAIAAALAFALTTPCCFLIKIGVIGVYTRMMKRSAELETSVRDHEYRKAMVYAEMMRASTINNAYSLSDILVCMVLDELVIVLATVPVETRSSVLIG